MNINILQNIPSRNYLCFRIVFVDLQHKCNTIISRYGKFILPLHQTQLRF